MPGVVVAPQPLAAEAGREILRRGGNAFDAAVAAAFVQTVTDPLMCGIGGMGIANLHVAKTGEQQIVGFLARFGARATPEMWAEQAQDGYITGHPDQIGYQSIATPGTVAGLGEIHRRWGSLPWADLVRPAARIAREGFALTSYIEDYFRYPSRPQGPAHTDRFTATPAMANLWLRPDGSFWPAGEQMANPAMAETLEAIAVGGPAIFYTGEIGQRIAADLAAHGALVTAQDLQGYQPRISAPLVGTYRGYTIATSPPPGGGLSLLQLLAVLEGFPINEMEHGSADHTDLLVQALRQVFADRAAYVGDPEFVLVEAERLLSPAHITQMRQRLGITPPAGPPSAPGTTHLSVRDAAGNCIAITHTLCSGSGVVTPGLGFQYNNASDHCDPIPGRPNSIAPGKARISAMAPTIVSQNGRPVLVLGSPGSNAIIGAVAQVIMNVIDFGLSAVEAVSAPRIHCEGGPVMLESRCPSAVVAELKQRGHEVRVRPYNYDVLQGRVQLIQAGPDDKVSGASDPRRDGGVALYS